MWRAQEIGLGISYEASCGNEADLDTLDFARFMLRSEATDIVLMAIEGIKDGEKLQGGRARSRRAREADRRAEVRPHRGRQPRGRVAHRRDRRRRRHLRRGLAPVRHHRASTKCDQLYETAVLLRKRRWPKGRGAASVSPTGGNIVQVADAGATLRRRVAASIRRRRRPRSQQLLPGYGKVDEPDRHDFARDRRARALSQRARPRSPPIPTIDVDGADLRVGLERRSPAGRRFRRELRESRRRCCGSAAAPTIRRSRAKDLVKAGVPVYRDATPCMRAMRAAMDFGDYVKAAQGAATTTPQRPAGIDHEDRFDAGSQRAAASSPSARRSSVLAAYGFPVTREQLAANARRGGERTRARSAAPVALKIDSPDIAHKTEAGAIRLGVQGDDAVARGVRRGHRRRARAMRRTPGSTACSCRRWRRTASR